jgi:hypothetical protein
MYLQADRLHFRTVTEMCPVVATTTTMMGKDKLDIIVTVAGVLSHAIYHR